MIYNRLSTVFAVFYLLVASLAQAQTLTKEQISQLKFRHLGPVGNRVTCSVGIPGDDQTYISGSATGGIWKTSDGGLNWRPVFDDKPVHSIGALAIAPSDPAVVYAGTGESFIRSNISIGNGVWKSNDGGETWAHVGLENTGRISRIVVDPFNADIAYAAAVGHAYTPQRERGVWKTTDGGKNWRQVLFVDENTGASDLVMDPSNPRMLVAGMWQLSLRPWNRTSGGPGSGLYQSRDGGETWTRLKGSGLPEGPVGKIALTMSANDPNRIYALIETGDGVESIGGAKPESGELWRSDDKGKNWKVVSHDRNMTGRQAYYTRCIASPGNANELHFLSANYYVSIDGGRSLEAVNPVTQPNWDHHDIWIDPKNADRMIVSGDGGISISKNRGKSWHRIQLANAQLYHVTTDNAVPYNVLTNRQDGPSMRGPSRSGVTGFFGAGVIPTGAWFDVGGGESGFATPDPQDPDVVWSSASGYGALGGVVTRYNAKNRQFRQMDIWPDFTVGHAAADVKYRFQWTFPLLISPHDRNTVYVASQVIHRSTNGGQKWDVVSPDLTLNDKSKQGKSGGLTPDNIGVEYIGVIYALEESPLKQGVLWAGTNDGLVQLSVDGSKTWSNLTRNIPDMPAMGAVRNIEASRWDAGKAYMVVDAHEMGDFRPYVYKTDNYGKTWKKITNGIGAGNLHYCRSIKEDPVRKGLLYLGTESALYVSFDEGENWQALMSNLPAAPMYWLDIQEHFNDLVIATYGRGIWILDDLSPLQQMPADVAGLKATLFKPKDVYRFQALTSNMQFFPDPSSGQDPPYGASINYWVASDADSVKIAVLNAAGDTVRTEKHKPKPGINRWWWNLQTNPIREIVLRTPPQGAENFPLDQNRTRKMPSTVPFASYLTPPGAYTVVMQVGAQTFSHPIKVLKDPNSDGSMSDIQAQMDLLTKLYADLNSLSDMVNNIELIRRQLYDLKAVLKAKGGQKPLEMEIEKIDASLQQTEGKLIQLKISGTGQDNIRWPAMLDGKLSYLASVVAVADFPPTDEQKEVYGLLKAQLNELKSEYEGLMRGPFAAFSALLKEKGLGVVR